MKCDNCIYNKEHCYFVVGPCGFNNNWPCFTPAHPKASQEGAEINDPVCHPGHYTSLPLEAIKTIRLALTEAYGPEGFKAYCFGNELKYRLRAGFKGDAQEDIDKALKYAEFRKGNFE